MDDEERQELEDLRRLEQLEQIYGQTNQQVTPGTLGERIGSRFDKMGEALGSDQSLPRTNYQVAGQLLGIPADVVGEGLSFAGRSINQLSGGSIGKGLSYLAEKAGGVPLPGGGTVGESVTGGMADAQKWYESLTPAQQRDFEATANIGAAALPLIGRVKQTGKAMAQVPKGLYAKRIPIKTAEQMRSAAGTTLNQAKQGGAIFSKKFGEDFLADVNKTLKPQGKWTQAASKNNAVDDLIERVNQMKGQALDLDDMAELDSHLGNLAYDTTDIAGNLTSEGRKFAQMQRILRQKVDDAATKRPDLIAGNKDAIDLLRKGRSEWSRAVRMQDVERIIRRAQRTQQPATSLRTGFKNLIESDPKLRGYTAKEKAAILKAADTGKITDTLKTLGSRLVPIGAGLTSGPAGFVAGEAVSSGARGLGVANQMNRARAVQSLLSQPVSTQITPEIAPALGTLGNQVFRSSVPVGAYNAIGDQPVNQLEYYKLFGAK